ncbi:MAG: hypothetical protein ACLVKK_10370 [Ruthenibacterium sp.]
MSEQRKTTGTHKRAPKKDTESKTTRTRKKVDRLRRAVLSSVKRLDCQRTRGQVHDRRAWWNMERVTEHREAPTLAA